MRPHRTSAPDATPDESDGNPDIALLVSTYQKPNHLRNCLESIAFQAGVTGRFEVVVTDDGSEDETERLVRDFAGSVRFPVRFTTHPHETFQLARCRNEGVLASTAPYLLFLDGDCLLPPNHVAEHLRARRPGVVMAGDCFRLEQATSARISPEVIRSGQYAAWVPASERKRLARRHRRAIWYDLIRHPSKPRLVGNNVAVWRRDYERVNGYDEAFEGWGCEDDDLGMRLRRLGLRVRSILARTAPVHLWHPPDVTAPQSWREGRNVKYLHQKDRPLRCLDGLYKFTKGPRQARAA
jgi:glycosyltransferase involved in cell wall biosynthesis